ncbi:MAG: ScaI family restriction endonuclease, partial [Sphaerospermopsis kisseleviana]
MVSPYSDIPVENWADKTKELIEQHPLDVNEIYKIV